MRLHAFGLMMPDGTRLGSEFIGKVLLVVQAAARKNELMD